MKIASARLQFLGLPEMVRKYHPPRIGPEKIPKRVLDHAIRVIRGFIKPEWLPPEKEMYQSVVGLPDFTTFVGRDRNGIVFSRAVQDILYWRYTIGKHRVFLMDTGAEIAVLVRSPDIRVNGKPGEFFRSWLARLVSKNIPVPEDRVRTLDGTSFADIPVFVTSKGKKHRTMAGLCGGPGYIFVIVHYSFVDPAFPFGRRRARPGYPSRF